MTWAFDGAQSQDDRSRVEPPAIVGNPPTAVAMVCVGTIGGGDGAASDSIMRAAGKPFSL